MSISKRPSTRRSVHEELSSGTQAFIVSHSPQEVRPGEEGAFLLISSSNCKALKHPRWWSAAAAKVMCGTLVRTTRVDQSSTWRRGRIENSSLRAGNGHSMMSRASPTYPSPTQSKLTAVRGSETRRFKICCKVGDFLILLTLQWADESLP